MSTSKKHKTKETFWQFAGLKHGVSHILQRRKDSGDLREATVAVHQRVKRPFPNYFKSTGRQ